MREPASVTVAQSIGGSLSAGGEAAVLAEPLPEIGVAILKRLMTPDAARALGRELRSRMASQDLTPDTAINGAWSAYADPIFQVLLLRTQAILEPLLREPLDPTYSYARVYVKGCDLPPHVDREACEVSVSLALATGSDRPWPFWAEYRDATYEVRLAPGDAVLYLGHECRHWREALADDWSAHVFLHYVRQNGPWAGYRFDETPG